MIDSQLHGHGVQADFLPVGVSDGFEQAFDLLSTSMRTARPSPAGDRER